MKKLLIASLLILLAVPLSAADDYLNQGASHLSAGDYQKAIRSYELAIKTKQDGAAAYKGLGLAYYKLGDREIAYDVEMISAAAKAFDQSFALKNDPEVGYLLGMSYLALDDKKSAEAAYARLKPSDPALAGKLAAKISAYVKPAAFDYSHPAAPPSDATSVLIEGNRVLVPVTLSYRGHAVTSTLMLDTGASVTAISEAVADRLGVEARDTHPALVTVADGRNVGSRWFVADSLAVGPKSLPDLRTAILPGSLPGVDGLLGMDFLKTVRYHVNFSRSVIEWNSR